MILALAGRPRETPPVVDWEGRRYLVDVAAAERLRLTHIRRAQAEVPLERAFQSASSSQGPRDLVHSLTALIYALALGDPDGAALAGGAVWRRHRFVAEGPGASEDTAWCVATESFGPSGWHLVGSLLALESAIPRLALRRLDPTSMPPPGRIGSSDRHAILLTVALMNPSAMTADDQAAVAAAIARGRERVEGLASRPDSVTQVAQDAGLSEWRANGLAWLLARDPSKAQTGVHDGRAVSSRPHYAGDTRHGGQRRCRSTARSGCGCRRCVGGIRRSSRNGPARIAVGRRRSADRRDSVARFSCPRLSRGTSSRLPCRTSSTAPSPPTSTTFCRLPLRRGISSASASRTTSRRSPPPAP